MNHFDLISGSALLVGTVLTATALHSQSRNHLERKRLDAYSKKLEHHERHLNIKENGLRIREETLERMLNSSLVKEAIAEKEKEEANLAKLKKAVMDTLKKYNIYLTVGPKQLELQLAMMEHIQATARVWYKGQIRNIAPFLRRYTLQFLANNNSENGSEIHDQGGSREEASLPQGTVDQGKDS